MKVTTLLLSGSPKDCQDSNTSSQPHGTNWSNAPPLGSKFTCKSRIIPTNPHLCPVWGVVGPNIDRCIRASGRPTWVSPVWTSIQLRSKSKHWRCVSPGRQLLPWTTLAWPMNNVLMLERLSSHMFERQVNESRNFWQRHQQPGKSFDDFILSLRELTKQLLYRRMPPDLEEYTGPNCWGPTVWRCRGGPTSREKPLFGRSNRQV